MSKADQQIAELVQPILPAGERLLVTASVSYQGTILANVLSIDASIASVDREAAAAVAGDQVPDADAAAFFPTANQMAMALTESRVFVWSLGFSGKPKQFVGSVPVAAIAEVRAHDPRSGSQLRIVMRSGAMIDLEFRKGEPAEEFTNELAVRVAAPAPVADDDLAADTAEG